MGLIDEAHFNATDARAFEIVQLRGRRGIDEYLAAVLALQQPGNMQQGRLAGSRRCHECNKLAWPNGKIRLPQDVQQVVALPVIAFDCLKEQDGVVSHRLTRSAALRPDRAGPRATRDRALPKATARVPSRQPPWFLPGPRWPVAATGNRAWAGTVRC